MRKAFTLAEILVTITIVGVVSLIIISFIPNIQKKYVLKKFVQ